MMNFATIYAFIKATKPVGGALGGKVRARFVEAFGDDWQALQRLTGVVLPDLAFALALAE